MYFKKVIIICLQTVNDTVGINLQCEVTDNKF